MDKAKLNGYLLACLGMLPTEEGEHHLEANSVAQKIERLRLRPSEFEVSWGVSCSGNAVQCLLSP